MDRQMDGGDYNIPFAFLKKCGDNHLFVLAVYNQCIKNKLFLPSICLCINNM